MATLSEQLTHVRDTLKTVLPLIGKASLFEGPNAPHREEYILCENAIELLNTMIPKVTKSAVLAEARSVERQRIAEAIEAYWPYVEEPDYEDDPKIGRWAAISMKCAAYAIANGWFVDEEPDEDRAAQDLQRRRAERDGM